MRRNYQYVALDFDTAAVGWMLAIEPAVVTDDPDTG